MTSTGEASTDEASTERTTILGPGATTTPAPPTLPPPTSSAPPSREGRSLAPDVARGLLLLFIALANVEGFHIGLPSPGPEPTTLDRVVSALEAVFVHNRSRPMFAILFGFGIAVMASRMTARGVDSRGVRRVLRRRSFWLMVFGAVHATFLWLGDILAAYGVTGLWALWLVHRDERVLRRWFWATLLIGTVGISLLSALPSDEGLVGLWGVTSYPEFMLQGLVASVFQQVLFLVLPAILPMVIIGFWLHRSEWLTRPQEHRAELLRMFTIAMVANLVLSVPSLLVGVEVWAPTGVAGGLFEAYDNLVGVVTGTGYLCGFALLAVLWSDRGRRGLPGVLAAVGERSLTAYLLQSVLFFAVLGGWGLGLGAHLGAAGDAVVAVAGWALIAAAMAVLARRDVRGPFDVLIRRLTYRALRPRRPRRRRFRGARLRRARPTA